MAEVAKSSIKKETEIKKELEIKKEADIKQEDEDEFLIDSLDDCESKAKEDRPSKTEEDEDPVWHSVRISGTTRVELTAVVYTPDQETEDLIKQLVNAQGGGEALANGYDHCRSSALTQPNMM